ncbi:MAG: hypothetical protein ACYS6W_04600 [Planctomycetota bacterium]
MERKNKPAINCGIKYNDEGKTMQVKMTNTAVALILLHFAATASAYDYDANDFAVEVVSYIEGTGVGFDVISFEPYNRRETALGRPTLETTGDMDIGPEISMVVVPVYPAWRAFEVVTIGIGGELVLRFNHRVGNDENNPYGIDFIIFGNARWQIEDGGSWGPESNPETVTVGGGFYAELGIVSVSQDGNDWYEFSTGPYADDFAPTAGYKWDDVNNVWAEELDPTRPLDPNLSITGFYGNSVAEIIDAYAGSAGGTGFDIGRLGLEWIQYVRIADDLVNPGTPEVDAIADVSCCGDYRHPYPAGDLNGDCRVNLHDFVIIATDWIDISDVGVLADDWLECTWECE